MPSDTHIVPKQTGKTYVVLPLRMVKIDMTEFQKLSFIFFILYKNVCVCVCDFIRMTLMGCAPTNTSIAQQLPMNRKSKNREVAQSTRLKQALMPAKEQTCWQGESKQAKSTSFLLPSLCRLPAETVARIKGMYFYLKDPDQKWIFLLQIKLKIPHSCVLYF